MSTVGDNATTSSRKIRNQLPRCAVPPPRRKTRELFFHWKQHRTKLKKTGFVKLFVPPLRGRWLFKDHFETWITVVSWKNGVSSVIFFWWRHVNRYVSLVKLFTYLNWSKIWSCHKSLCSQMGLVSQHCYCRHCTAHWRVKDNKIVSGFSQTQQYIISSWWRHVSVIWPSSGHLYKI
jgi:hypothetical protein